MFWVMAFFLWGSSLLFLGTGNSFILSVSTSFSFTRFFAPYPLTDSYLLQTPGLFFSPFSLIFPLSSSRHLSLASVDLQSLLCSRCSPHVPLFLPLISVPLSSLLSDWTTSRQFSYRLLLTFSIFFQDHFQFNYYMGFASWGKGTCTTTEIVFPG